jgi:hypothetical protein
MSPSALFRSIGADEGLPTILFDEIDTIFGAKAREHEELRGLLNAGHRRGAKTYRSVVAGKKITVETIEAFSAVALAGLGWLPDTLLSRSIVVRMQRRHAGERVEPFRRRICEPEGRRIRNLIEEWAATVSKINWPSLPSEIQDRDADKWEPIIAIGDIVGGEWPKKAREAAKTMVLESCETEPSLGIKLLADIKDVFGSAKTMSSEEMVGRLNNLPESPWGNLNGRPLDQRGIAVRLRQYGIKSKNIRTPSTLKGYERNDFDAAWRRYTSATAATSATGKTEQGNSVADDELQSATG